MNLTKGTLQLTILLGVVILILVGIVGYLVWKVQKHPTPPTPPTPPQTSLKLLYPKGGEVWKEGETYKIKWETKGVKKVNIEYGDGKSYFVVQDYPADKGEYEWTPQGIVEQYEGFVMKPLAEVQIKISVWDAENPNLYDKSDDITLISQETADWKTYRNEKYGFEFEYPKIYDEEKEYQLCRISESKDKNFITLAGRIQISVLDSNGLNLNEYIDSLIEEGRLQIETKAVEGDKATITYRIQDSLAYGIINFYINKLKNDGKIYMIALERPFNLCDYNQTSIWEVYDKVVSSFRFIEPVELKN